MSGLNEFLKSFDKRSDKDNKQDKPFPEPTQDKQVRNIKINQKQSNTNKQTSTISANKRSMDTTRLEQGTQQSVKQNRPETSSTGPLSADGRVSKETIERLFYESETKEEFKQEWIEIYMRGLRSRKKNGTVRKIVNGRFRIMPGGKMEILPDMKTHNKTSKEILKTKWL